MTDSPKASHPDFPPPDRSPEAHARRLSRIEVRDAGIKGKGLFAILPIPATEVLIEYRGTLLDAAGMERQLEAGNVYLFRANQEICLDGDIPDNPAKYINHSCNPNCRSVNLGEELWIYPLRDIAPGEEISFDYGYLLTEEGMPPCHCGAPNCFRFIVATASRWEMPTLSDD